MPICTDYEFGFMHWDWLDIIEYSITHKISTWSPGKYMINTIFNTLSICVGSSNVNLINVCTPF